MTAETVNDEEVSFDLSGDPTLNESPIITTDIEATSGVVHARILFYSPLTLNYKKYMQSD